MKNNPISFRGKHPAIGQLGFSLVEILVGLVIGLLATLVIMQGFSVFEGQKRSTTGSADAQTNGGIALYSLTRDLADAGFGLLPFGSPGTVDSVIECDDTATTILAAAAAAGMPASSPLSPVIITDGGLLGQSDTITIRKGTSSMAGTPLEITGWSGPVTASVINNLGCQAGIAVTLPTCNITTATPAASAVSTTEITLGDNDAATSGNSLACLGEWRENVYAVNGNNLELNGTPVVTDIVNIQAQYGISATPDSNTIVQWVNATSPWDAATITTTNRNRIKSLRVAVTARNGTMEKTDVTSPCGTATPYNTGPCSWDSTSANPTILSDSPAINLSDNNNWRKYRYRVFESIIPLRIVVWSKGTL